MFDAKPVYASTQPKLPAIEYGKEPAPGTGTSYFALVANTKIRFEAGKYRFQSLSDDGFRLFVDGKEVISRWNHHGATPDEAAVELTAGMHEIVVHYCQEFGGCVLLVGWERKVASQVDEFAFLSRFHPVRQVEYVRWSHPSFEWVFRAKKTILYFRASAEDVVKVGQASGSPLFPTNSPPGWQLFQSSFGPIDGDKRGYRCGLEVYEPTEFPPRVTGVAPNPGRHFLKTLLGGTTTGCSNLSKVLLTPPVRRANVDRVRLTHLTAERAYKRIIDANIIGLDFLAYDPADESLVFRATPSATLAVQALLAKIDVPPGEVRKFRLRKVEALALMGKFEPLKGIDFIASDPTDNSIVARGTPEALETLAKRIAELDKG